VICEGGEASVDEAVAGRGNEIDVLEELCRVLVEQCDVPADRVSTLTVSDPMESLGIDSIGLAYVITHFERKYELTFDNEDVDPVRYGTVGDLADSIVRRISVRDA
jgi:acyl carrier protein